MWASFDGWTLPEGCRRRTGGSQVGLVKHFGTGQQGVRVDIRSGEQIRVVQTVELEGDANAGRVSIFPASAMKQAASSASARSIGESSCCRGRGSRSQ